MLPHSVPQPLESSQPLLLPNTLGHPTDWGGLLPTEEWVSYGILVMGYLGEKVKMGKGEEPGGLGRNKYGKIEGKGINSTSHVIRLLFSKLAWLIPERDDYSLSCLTTACVCVCLSPQQPPIYRVGPGLPQDSRHAGFSSLLKARMACPEHPVLMARYQAQKNYFIAVFMETWTVLDDLFYPFVSPDLIQINQSVNKWHAKESGE